MCIIEHERGLRCIMMILMILPVPPPDKMAVVSVA